MPHPDATWSALWGRRRHLIAIARRYGFTREEAEDLVGDVILRVAQQPALDPATLDALLNVATTRECQSRIATAVTRRRLLARTYGDDRLARPADEAATEHVFAAWCVTQLPQRERLVAMLQAHGLSRDEIAARTGLGYAVVDKLLTQGRRSLRRFAGVTSVLTYLLTRPRRVLVPATATVTVVAIAGALLVHPGRAQSDAPVRIVRDAPAVVARPASSANTPHPRRAPAKTVGRGVVASPPRPVRRPDDRPPRAVRPLMRTPIIDVTNEEEPLDERVARCLRNGVEVVIRDNYTGVTCREDPR